MKPYEMLKYKYEDWEEVIVRLFRADDELDYMLVNSEPNEVFNEVFDCTIIEALEEYDTRDVALRLSNYWRYSRKFKDYYSRDKVVNYWSKLRYKDFPVGRVHHERVFKFICEALDIRKLSIHHVNCILQNIDSQVYWDNRFDETLMRFDLLSLMRRLSNLEKVLRAKPLHKSCLDATYEYITSKYPNLVDVDSAFKVALLTSRLSGPLVTRVDYLMDYCDTLEISRNLFQLSYYSGGSIRTLLRLEPVESIAMALRLDVDVVSRIQKSGNRLILEEIGNNRDIVSNEFLRDLGVSHCKFLGRGYYSFRELLSRYDKGDGMDVACVRVRIPDYDDVTEEDAKFIIARTTEENAYKLNLCQVLGPKALDLAVEARIPVGMGRVLKAYAKRFKVEFIKFMENPPLKFKCSEITIDEYLVSKTFVDIPEEYLDDKKLLLVIIQGAYEFEEIPYLLMSRCLGICDTLEMINVLGDLLRKLGNVEFGKTVAFYLGLNLPSDELVSTLEIVGGSL